MATVERATTISREAVRLLDCFRAGLNKVVLELAEEQARERCGTTDAVQIERTDVEKAGDDVLRYLRELAEEQKLPSEVVELLSSVDNCFRQKR